MIRSLFITLSLLISCAGFSQKYLDKNMAEVTTTWNNAEFSSAKSVSENIASMEELSIYTQLMKDKQLQQILDKEEMVTIFVIHNDAFSDLKKKQKDSLFANKKGIEKMITFLAIPGRVDRNGMEVAARKNKNKAQFATLNGESLIVIEENGKLFLQDANGKRAAVIASNFYHKNGLFHIIDKRLSPDRK